MVKEDVVHIYNGILLSHKNKLIPFAVTWMGLEIIILNEVKDKISYDVTYVKSKRLIQVNLFTQQK